MTFESSPHLALRHLIQDQTESVLASILDSLDYGVLLTDLGHLSLACNQRFGELFRIPIRDVVKEEPLQVREMVRSVLRDYDAWAQNLEEVYADPERVQDDLLWLANPRVILRRHTAPVLGETGKPVARLWTFQDCTAEYRREAMRECLHETSLVFDPNPRVIYDQITRQVAKLYDAVAILSIRVQDYMEFRAVAGLPDGVSLPGNPLSDSYCQFCLERDAPLIIQDARQSEAASETLAARAGFTRYAGVPLKDPDQRAIGTFCIMDSRSEEPLDDEDLGFLSLCAMRISSELERERQISTLSHDLEVTQSKLIQSEKLAATGAIAASVAHDIRNILSAISLTTQMGGGSPQEILDEVNGHLTRFQVLSHKLLSYARPQRLVHEPVALAEVLNRVLDLLKIYERVSRIKIELDLPGDLPHVVAEPSYLDHLFINLLLNGIQASKGGTSIRISARPHGRFVRISVKDQGSGIPQELIETIFEPFSSTKRTGLGLGLYSCRQIVRECKGKISVKSAVGEGTEFEIELPSLAL